MVKVVVTVVTVVTYLLCGMIFVTTLLPVAPKVVTVYQGKSVSMFPLPSGNRIFIHLCVIPFTL